MVSVDTPARAREAQATYEIPFPVLSDPDAIMIDAFNVVNELDEAGVERLEGFGIDVEAWSDREHHKIAIPSIFLVDEEGVVRWAHAAHDYKRRPSLDQVVEAIAPIVEGAEPAAPGE